MNQNSHTLDISWETILKIALSGVAFYVLFLIKDIIIWFLFALIISVLFEPAINFLRALRINKILAVVFIYLSFFGILGLAIYLTAPIFIIEIKQFSQMVPDYFEKISPIFKELKIGALQDLESFTKTITGGLEQVSVSIFNALSTFFGGVVSALFIISIAFFLSIEEKGLETVLRLLSPKKYEDFVLSLFAKCQKKVSGWFGARILACVFIAVASFIVFSLFQIKYTFTLAFLAGVLAFIPFLGALVTGILLVLFVGVADSWLKALIVLIGFIIINQIENSIISPTLMKKFIGLPPVLVLLAIVIGGKMFGFLGAIFAIPIFGILFEFTKEFLEKKKEEGAQLV
ncbi:AI-2E family transporter [Patescibacteria group bacterium]|nr:AI-2E family transporter [Patescibacteria group bacterium]